ncbi:AEC family transporter [Halomonas sp. HMF6819]|uniref:AEC family transporter n=1 Tax=Halomonas sp. HMF6819 TaxID=3373085 RepID=UPI0037BA4018
MDLSFATLAGPLLTLLSFVALGFVAAKRLKVNPQPIATLLVYVIAPFTVFRALMNGDPTAEYLTLTLALFLFTSTLALVVNALGRRVFGAHEAALLAFSSGTGNTGYFGLPIALILLPPEGVTLYLFCMLGINLYEFTVGFYLSARGQFSVRQSLIKISRLPLLYAFALALLLGALSIRLPAPVMESLSVFPASYTLLGMMIIGMTLSQARLAAWDTRFVLACLGLRYVLWPALMLIGVLVLDAWLGLSPTLALALLLLSVVPMASNVVVVAMELGIEPQKGALAVLTSTLLAPLLIPLYLGVMLSLTGLG